jgi:AcrR family transcriptional regulator
MPRVKPEYKHERRERIIDAARRCFARLGFHETTLQDVFREAELSAGAVYNYFRSKDELIEAIAEQRHQDERELLLQAVDQENPIDALTALAYSFAETYLSLDCDEKRRISLHTWAEATVRPSLMASVKHGFETPKDLLVALIERGQANDQFATDLNADAVARAAIALLHGFILQKLWDPDFDLDANLALYAQLIRSFAK